MTIDLVLPFFAFGEPAFQRLVSEFRTRLCEEVAASSLPGLILTYVWALDDPRDKEFVDHLAGIFSARGRGVCHVELAATVDERLRRNESPLRLEGCSALRPRAKWDNNRRSPFSNTAEMLDLEPFRETAYQQLMRLHATRGDRAEALRVFERCRRLLQDELGTSPSPQTEAVFRRILQSEST